MCLATILGLKGVEACECPLTVSLSHPAECRRQLILIGFRQCIRNHGSERFLRAAADGRFLREKFLANPFRCASDDGGDRRLKCVVHCGAMWADRRSWQLRTRVLPRFDELPKITACGSLSVGCSSWLTASAFDGWPERLRRARHLSYQPNHQAY